MVVVNVDAMRNGEEWLLHLDLELTDFEMAQLLDKLSAINKPSYVKNPSDCEEDELPF